MNETPDHPPSLSGANDIGALYQDLKRLARAQRLREPDATINTTALVHDLYLNLVGRDGLQFADRLRFFAYAAKAMRHLLIDRARAKSRYKAGGDLDQVDLEDVDFLLPDAPVDGALELDSALNALAAEDARAAEVVELHVFAGLPIEQIATLMQVSGRTIERDWKFARAFLKASCGG